ncbi:MAG TPA: hypothetical protein VNT23_06180, partial [Gaiellaceae bacterium]|nr:hypothetical protein [Gaiellaceae bacterium]
MLTSRSNVQHHDRAASAARADLRRAALLVEAHHEQVVGSARHLLVALRQTREVSEGGSGCARALREIVRRDARYANLGVVDTNGLLRCSARNHRGVPPDLTGFVGSTL